MKVTDERGLRIGRHAGESVMDALRNGQIEDSEALAIADFAPGNENVQRKGLAILMEGGSKTEARERMVAELELAKMARMVAEAMAVMESVEGILPNEYRYGMEAGAGLRVDSEGRVGEACQKVWWRERVAVMVGAWGV